MSANPSQDFIPVNEIRDGVVVLKSGQICRVLLVSATNLALKSPDEQQATILAFQNFLNTLDFSVQIVTQSRKFDIRPYLETLEQRVLVIPEELLRIQTQMYIEYVRTIADQQNIMQKHFFIVVPWNTISISRVSGSLFNKGKSSDKTAEQVSFDEKQSQLDQRVAVVESGLASLGLRTSVLDTESLIELYYQLYNPGDTVGSMSNLIQEQPATQQPS